MVEREAKKVKSLIRKTVRTLKRMGWKWNIEIGEWACYRLVKGGISEPECIIAYNGKQIWLHRIGWLISSRALVPVLHWEKILAVLKTLGFSYTLAMKDGWIHLHVFDSKGSCVARQDGFPQPAVMRATIELEKNEKELKKYDKNNI